jgi:putative tryptophan/tyrosine transport system substrate-binding protein
MRRREFFIVFGNAIAWPLRGHAQQPEKKWLIGFIAHGYEVMYGAFFERLRELGYVEGQNTMIERRYAGGQAERFQDFAREMVKLNADVIVTITTPQY